MTHIAAVSQIRLDTDGRTYYRRKRTEGKTPLEAIRCLKRRTSDALYRQLVADAAAPVAHANAAREGTAGVVIQRGQLDPAPGTSDEPLPGPAPTTLRRTTPPGKTEPMRHLEPAG